VAKAVYQHPHTRATLEALRASPVLRRICGFVRRADIPSEATFSRALAEFARSGLGEKVHAALVAEWVKIYRYFGNPDVAAEIFQEAL